MHRSMGPRFNPNVEPRTCPCLPVSSRRIERTPFLPRLTIHIYLCPPEISVGCTDGAARTRMGRLHISLQEDGEAAVSRHRPKPCSTGQQAIKKIGRRQLKPQKSPKLNTLGPTLSGS